MPVHKDSYSAIDLTQQGGLHRRKTKRIASDLDPWLIAASKSLVASFASGCIEG